MCTPLIGSGLARGQGSIVAKGGSRGARGRFAASDVQSEEGYEVHSRVARPATLLMREAGRSLRRAELVGFLLVFGGHQRQGVGGLPVANGKRQAAALTSLRPEKFGLPAVGDVDEDVDGSGQMAPRTE